MSTSSLKSTIPGVTCTIRIRGQGRMLGSSRGKKHIDTTPSGASACVPSPSRAAVAAFSCSHLNLSLFSFSVPRSMWSFTRPGVPTTTSTPCVTHTAATGVTSR